MLKKYYFSDIIVRLNRYVRADVGYRGFRTLVYGWRIKHRLPVYTFYGRDYMNESEIHSFSEYAGYDLSREPDS